MIRSEIASGIIDNAFIISYNDCVNRIHTEERHTGIFPVQTERTPNPVKE